MESEHETGARAFNWEAAACVVSVVLLCALAAHPLYKSALEQALPWTVEAWHWAAAFGFAAAFGVIAAWVKAVLDQRLPATPLGAPKHAHIGGWSVLLIVAAIGSIVLLAGWAASGDEEERAINANWGVFVVFSLAALFIVVALAPSWNLQNHVGGFGRLIQPLIRPFGRVLSMIDSVLVFTVAGSAGATQRGWGLRYFILFGLLAPCAVLGYFLPAPWGLIPIAWGFLIAVAMSRRWAWVEDDRELAMLNGRFTGDHLRIGFDQDLRDEALLSFMSMFFLAPLALRQMQEWTPMFDMGGIDKDNLMAWIAFYGSELAKAVPFVDWAEIYNVHGDAGITIGNDAMAKHVVFATRVIVDLVFLAALLQALSISARNAKQRDLFTAGTLHRLDPFIERKEFRKLVRRNDRDEWDADVEAIAQFPHYDPIRLGELSDPQQPKWLRLVANALRKKQGGATSEEFHEELMRRAMTAKKDREAIIEVVQAIRAAGPERDIYLLDQSRQALNGAPHMVEARTQVMRLIADAPASAERTKALLDAIVPGPARDSLGPVRAAAIAGLAQEAAAGEPGVVGAIKMAAEASDSTNAEKRAAQAILARLG